MLFVGYRRVYRTTTAEKLSEQIQMHVAHEWGTNKNFKKTHILRQAIEVESRCCCYAYTDNFFVFTAEVKPLSWNTARLLSSLSFSSHIHICHHRWHTSTNNFYFFFSLSLSCYYLTFIYACRYLCSCVYACHAWMCVCKAVVQLV